MIWNFEKVLNAQAPHFDNRQAAQVRPRLPSVASYRKIDDMTVEVTTRAVDSFFPYQMLCFLISSPTQYERLGRSWERFSTEPSGTGPFRLARLVPRERAELEQRLSEQSDHVDALTDEVTTQAMALGPPLAVIVVPSSGSTAMSTSGPPPALA